MSTVPPTSFNTETPVNLQAVLKTSNFADDKSFSETAKKFYEVASKFDGKDDSAEAIWDAMHTFLVDQFGSLVALVAALKYDGFSPKEFVKNFYLKGIKLMSRLDGNKDPNKKKSSGEIFNDLMLLLAYADQQGTNINARKLGKLTNAASQAKLQEIVNDYDVRDGVENVGGRQALGSSASNTITLGRVLACFPHITSQLIKMGKIKPIYSSGTIDPMLCHTNSSALIPKHEAFDKLFEAIVDNNTEISLILARRNKKYAGRSKEEVREETRDWCVIARNGSALTDEERMFFLSYHGGDAIAEIIKAETRSKYINAKDKFHKSMYINPV